MEHYNINEYLEIVRQQIRWKKVQTLLLQEIRDHITDQTNVYIREGLDKEAAIHKAIAEMGDPIAVGGQLDRAHRPKPDWPLLTITAILLLLGLIIQFLIKNSVQFGLEMFTKQVIWAGVAIIVMFAAYFLDFTILGKYPKLMFLGLGIFTAANYVYSHVKIRGIDTTMIYPLMLLPLVFAGLVYNLRTKALNGLILSVIAFLVFAFLAIAIPGITIFFLIFISCLVILTVAIFNGWFSVRKLSGLLIVYIPTVIALFFMFLTIMNNNYDRLRLQMVFHPSQDPTGYGYVPTVIRQLLFHSRLIGEGLPISSYGQNSISKFLPDINTNFLLTYIIYKFGWILFFGIILLFLTFIFRSFAIRKKQKSALARMVSLAIILTFMVQFITFVASNIGFMLFPPLSLPLISYGGRALVINMCLVGFLLSIFRTGDFIDNSVYVSAAKTSRFIKFDDDKIIIDLKTSPIKLTKHLQFKSK